MAWLARRRALALSLLLFALALPPLLLATWGFGRALSTSETDSLDLRIAATLAAVEAEVGHRADGAEARAATLARSTALQDALRKHDLPALRRVMAAQPGTAVDLSGGRRIGTLPRVPRTLRRVEILAGSKQLGSLVTGASFLPAAGTRDGVSVVVTRSGRIVAGSWSGSRLAATARPSDVRLGGRVYRASGVQLAGGRLVGLAARAPIDATVRRRQEEIALAVLGTLLALSLGMALLVRGRRRRIDEARSAGAVTLVENLLGAVHDPDAMLAVVLESAVAVTGAAGGTLSWGGETVERGAPADGRSSLEVELADTDGSSAGRLTLVSGGEPFDRETAVLARAVAERAAAALQTVRRQRVAQYEALTDELTGLANRRRFRQVLELEISRATRSGTPLALVLADLDAFKQINDAHGHHAGDEVLHAFARLLAERVRATDVAARLGGDEFVVVLPDTGLSGATALAENLRAALLEDVAAERGQSTTASFGVAVHVPGASGDEFLRAADDALYRAKREGRNRVVAAIQAAG